MNKTRELKMYKAAEMEPGQTENIETLTYTEVRLDGLMFNRDFVTRIKIHRFNRDPEEKNQTPTLFVTLYLGNLEVCTKVTNDDIVVETERRESGIAVSYLIRVARDYDYKR